MNKKHTLAALRKATLENQEVSYLFFWGHTPQRGGLNLLGFTLMDVRSFLSENVVE